MGSFGGMEWVVIILAVLLLFGAKKIPELARGLGQGINEFRRASNDIKNEIERSKEEENPDMHRKQQYQQYNQEQQNHQQSAEEHKEKEAPKASQTGTQS